ncbi:MAG: choice-of-anchor J domain-containing protein, partial [Anaerolineae bacterium]|nr:choice-of-anchor J domain-containing protein [Anaerolineae bacterium]
MSRKPILSLLVVFAFVAALLPAPAALSAPPAQEGQRAFEAAGAAQTTQAGEPPRIMADVDLILDDGSVENNIGIGGTWEFIYLNRFTPDPGVYPFNLDQIQVYFDSSGLGQVGDDITLVVYENTTGNTDPAVGANWLASFPAAIQALDAWNVYDLSTPVLLNGPGDVLIGVIALETPGTSYWPAALDQTTTQQRSWAGWWLNSPPPDPPTLPPDDSWTLIDTYFPGNWMIRGSGSFPTGPTCDWENRLTEDFASTTFPPTGWTRYNLDTGSAQWNRSSSYYHSYPGSAYHYRSSTPDTGQDGWLVSPPLSDLELLTTLRFWERASYSTDYAYHGVWVSTGSCVPTDGDFVEVAEVGEATTSFVQKTVDLAAYEGQEACVAFVYRGYYADYWYIDDIQVDTCVPPPLIVSPAEQTNPGCQGGTAVHSVSVRNTSGGPHTYEASVSGNAWPTSPVTTTFTLTDEEEIWLDFTVDIPPTAFDGESDTVAIQVVAQDDPTMTETVSATAYAGKIWVPAPEGGGATLWPAYATDGASMFYFDGKDEGGAATDRLQIYTPGAGWSTGTADGVALYGSLAGSASDGLIYVAGGFEDGQIATALFQAYDPATSGRASLPDMPQALGLGGGGVSGDKFVWIGGSPNSGLLSYTPVYVYDITGGSWTAGTSLADVGLTAPGHVVADGKVYVGGNWLGSDLFYAYDVAADTWTQLADLPAAAGKISPLFIYDGGDEIYLVGGGTAPSQATDAVYRYVISEDTWYEESGHLTWPTLGNGGGLLGGYLYTFGGGLNVAAAQAEDGVVPHEFRLLSCPDLDAAILSGYVTNGVTGEPIEGALVEAVATGVVLYADTTPFAYTDENGYYELTLYTPATYNITASYMDFDPKTEEVVLPSEGASQDFVLGPPVANPSPTSFSVTLPWGVQDVEIMTLANDGYSALDFEFAESDGGGPFVAYGPQAPAEPLEALPDKAVQEARVLLDSQPASGEPDELLAPPSEVELVMDDGTQENGLVLRDPTTLVEFRAVLFNRFEAASVPAEGFVIQYIDIHQDTGQLEGKDIQLLVYVDPDGGSPQNAILVYDEVVQVQDETGWNSYQLAEPVAINGPVDVLVGFSTIYAAGGIPWPSGVRY